MVIQSIPWTISTAGSLLTVDNGFRLKAVQVMFFETSEVDAVIRRTDMRMLSASFTKVVDITIPISFPICSLFNSHINASAEPVHIKSATPLSEMLTDLGGIVMPAAK